MIGPPIPRGNLFEMYNKIFPLNWSTIELIMFFFLSNWMTLNWPIDPICQSIWLFWEWSSTSKPRGELFNCDLRSAKDNSDSCISNSVICLCNASNFVPLMCGGVRRFTGESRVVFITATFFLLSHYCQQRYWRSYSDLLISSLTPS